MTIGKGRFTNRPAKEVTPEVTPEVTLPTSPETPAAGNVRQLTDDEKLMFVRRAFPPFRIVTRARGSKPDSAFGQELEAELNTHAEHGYACLHAFMPDSRTFHAILLNTINPVERVKMMFPGTEGTADDSEAQSSA